MIKHEEEERLEGSPVSDKAEIEEDEEDEEEDEEEEEDENIDVEETDEIVEELLDGSDTSCSAGSPHIASSPSAMASLLGGADSPQSSSDGSSASVNAPATVPSSSGPEKRHICEMCGKGFPYLSILESHKRCHTGEKPFHCKHCDKSFAQKATLQVHERTHTGERPYKCRYCEKTFAQYGTKTVHEKSAHLGIRNYKCPKCDKCLSSPSALYTHKKTHGEKTFKCEFCPKTFTLKNYLKLHVKQVHEQNERKHVCRYCGKSFAYAGSLQVHVRTHTGERPYSCRFCPKAFASQGNLQSHERTHTGERPYSCGTCGRSFIQKSQLTAHEATHTFPPLPTSTTTPTGAEPERKGTSQYVCKYCGKAYQYASSLYVHTRLHTGERPFSCQFCDKRFTNQGNMQVHQRVHTGERPYSCSGCGKSYAQKVGLKIHLEQCQPYLENRSNSESPINVDTDSDCSDESKKMDYAPVPNIYKDCSPPLLPPLPSYAQLSLPDLGLKLQPQTPKLSSFHPLPTAPSLSSFRAPELPVDFGPLAASKPPSFQLDLTMPEALSAFSTPVKAQTPPPSLLDTSLLLKGLLENINQGNALLQQPLLNTNHLLSTQLLLQQLGHHQTDLSSLLHQSTPSLSSSLLGSLLTPSLMCPQFKDLA